MHQQPLARLELRGAAQIADNRCSGFRQSGGGHQIDAGGNRQHLPSRNQHGLGVATAGQQGADLVAHCPAGDVGTDGPDASAAPKPSTSGLARRRRVETPALQQVGAIDAGGGDVDQDLIGPRQRQVRHLPANALPAPTAADPRRPRHASGPSRRCGDSVGGTLAPVHLRHRHARGRRPHHRSRSGVRADRGRDRTVQTIGAPKAPGCRGERSPLLPADAAPPTIPSPTSTPPRHTSPPWSSR